MKMNVSTPPKKPTESADKTRSFLPIPHPNKIVPASVNRGNRGWQLKKLVADKMNNLLHLKEFVAVGEIYIHHL